MNRKEFLKTAGSVGVACCGLSLLAVLPAQAQQAAEKATNAATPEQQRLQWIDGWAKRFFDVLERDVDEDTRRRIMDHNGQACHRASSKPTVETITLEKLVDALKKSPALENVRAEGNTVYLNYVKKQTGDGCLCQLVQDVPPGFSKTYCYCSAGYIRDSFETATGRKAKVQLLESIKGGGARCRFRVDVA